MHKNRTTEFISLKSNVAIKGPALTIPQISKHCMIQVDSNTYILIGGYQGAPSARFVVRLPLNVLIMLKSIFKKRELKITVA